MSKGNDPDRRMYEVYLEVLDILDRYHFKRLHLSRIGTMALVGVCAFGLALAEMIDSIYRPKAPAISKRSNSASDMPSSFLQTYSVCSPKQGADILG